MESMDSNSLLDLSKDLSFLAVIGKFLMTCEVTMGTMTVFAKLEFLRSWKPVLLNLEQNEQKEGKRRRKSDSNLLGMHLDPC